MTVKRLFGAVLVLPLIAFGIGFAAPMERESTVMGEIVDAVNTVKIEFPAIKNAEVWVGDLPENIYAVTETSVDDGFFTGRITVNEYFSDRQKMQSSIDNDVLLGFHPALGHCTAAQFIAYHESAHLVDASEGDTSHDVLFHRFGNGLKLRGILSGYSFYRGEAPWVGGMINMSEALAEAFAAVHCNGGNGAEKELNNMLENGEIRELRNQPRGRQRCPRRQWRLYQGISGGIRQIRGE